MLEVREQVDHVMIPKINQDLPIYAGSEEDNLQRGVGHLEGISLPIVGASTHAVLSGQRGMSAARLFADLDKMKKGDYFYVTNLKETLAYQVDRIMVIEPSQLDAVSIEEDKDYVTLLTCTPYMGSLSTVMGDLSLTTRENQLGSLSFWMFKAMRILLLKFLKLRKPKACRLMSLISLLVASNLALERDS